MEASKQIFFPDWEEVQVAPNVTFKMTEDMRFNSSHKLSIIFYSVLMFISGIGNISVLTILFKQRHGYNSPLNIMLINLAIADLLVTFILMPMDILWASTVRWIAGDEICRICAFFRTFGLYQSSFVIACISIDRYFAILRPMHITRAAKRGKMMVTTAWFGSCLCSIPQMIVFRAQTHPNVTWYEQCITVNSFPSHAHELTYSLFGMIMMYAMPLCIVIYSYFSILKELNRKATEANSDIRRSGLGYLEKAKVKTLRMTIIIVAVFIVCWTPYYVMSLWHWIDQTSAKLVDRRIQKGMFMFACTNSCMNPIVYGIFNIKRKRRCNTYEKSYQNKRNTMSTDIRLPTIHCCKSITNGISVLCEIKE